MIPNEIKSNKLKSYREDVNEKNLSYSNFCSVSDAVMMMMMTVMYSNCNQHLIKKSVFKVGKSQLNNLFVGK